MFSWYWKREGIQNRRTEKKRQVIGKGSRSLLRKERGERERLSGRKKEVPRKSGKGRERSGICWRVVCNVRHGENNEIIHDIWLQYEAAYCKMWNFTNILKFLKMYNNFAFYKKKMWMHWDSMSFFFTSIK